MRSFARNNVRTIVVALGTVAAASAGALSVLADIHIH
jgi:hypothetical protein